MSRDHWEGLLVGFGTGAFMAIGIIWLDAVIKHWRR